ncbi:Protein tyrosine phosphatase CDC14 [Scheffersomyces stipitis CBS 6054]|uniref:Tyrosine-protein phosphatase CDC14 n=1 Tax=Scheffersomyces stipitis (strain ATCC 58785 / CBS 6054 / NBRC 10063 / NRRL Y-11545) TaxID=322104 RepID=A3LUZ0_PICST|nr:Protein tyrosine phosphatase CDC14 [Scheffersomyces stipitis CBS 6054]ABN67039.2 Protein tyrosine phosphatase CDC14 [Scheffersomyces stipitis CBS 6054]
MAKSRVSVPVIEFLKNRIYLGAFDSTPVDTNELVYFTVEDALPYNAFHLDFGPLHIGNLYRFAVVLHNILNEESNQGKAIVFYSSTAPKMRSNAACLLCCYMVLVQSWSPHQVLQPIAQLDPPFQGFRDAGYSTADFEITIQDIVYAMWRAKERGMIDLTTFNLEEYEQYERVDQGDFNVISKDFIAFASPQQSSRKAGLNEPFRKVLSFFVQNDVQLVVRLNSHLYDANEFTKRNIQHIDMIFDDGTCPTLEYVQKFIGAAETVINKGGKIAVHCKAGLGRTGCLIGAHLIYTHGFTANECIAYMRMIRPGMVVGPQQHWLYLHQNDFRDWRHTMILDNRPDEFIGGLFPLTSYDEFKARMRQESKQRKLQSQQSVNSSVNYFDSSFHTPIRRRKISGALAAKIQTAVPNESPGQPRKYKEDANSSVVELINNSDEENLEAMQDVSTSRKDSNYDIEAELNTDEDHSREWKVLRSISTNGTNQPVSLTKTTTTTTTRTVSTTLSSSPQQSPSHHSIKMPKSRSSSRVSSGMIQSKNEGYHGSSRVSSAGIKKVAGVSGRKM